MNTNKILIGLVSILIILIILLGSIYLYETSNDNKANLACKR